MFNKKKYFLLSMIYSTMVLFLLVGFTVVEKAANNVIYAEKRPFLSYDLSGFMRSRVNFHFMGKDFVVRF